MKLINWKMKPTGNCPMQAEGWFLGWYFYFRARHDKATIEFCYDEEDWENDLIRAKYILDTMPDPMAGWMPKWKCTLLIYFGCCRFFFKRDKNRLHGSH
jgi:hypothetical protein